MRWRLVSVSTHGLAAQLPTGSGERRGDLLRAAEAEVVQGLDQMVDDTSRATADGIITSPKSCSRSVSRSI
jgi:hypothetical protein